MNINECVYIYIYIYKCNANSNEKYRNRIRVAYRNEKGRTPIMTLREQDKHICQIAVKDFEGEDHQAQTLAAAGFMAQLAQEFVENKLMRDALYQRRDEMAQKLGMPPTKVRRAKKADEAGANDEGKKANEVRKRPAGNDKGKKANEVKKDNEAAHVMVQTLVKKDTCAFFKLYFNTYL